MVPNKLCVEMTSLLILKGGVTGGVHKIRTLRRLLFGGLRRQHGLRQSGRIIWTHTLLPQPDILLALGPLAGGSTAIELHAPALASHKLTLVHLLAFDTVRSEHRGLLCKPDRRGGRPKDGAIGFGLLRGERGRDVLLGAQRAELRDGRRVSFGEGVLVVLVEVHGKADSVLWRRITASLSQSFPFCSSYWVLFLHCTVLGQSSGPERLEWMVAEKLPSDSVFEIGDRQWPR